MAIVFAFRVPGASEANLGNASCGAPCMSGPHIQHKMRADRKTDSAVHSMGKVGGRGQFNRKRVLLSQRFFFRGECDQLTKKKSEARHDGDYGYIPTCPL